MFKKVLLAAFGFVSLLAFIVTLTLLIDAWRLQKRNVFPGEKAVYVFNYGWHTGLVFALKDIPEDFEDYFGLFSKHRFVEVSWGDARFYQNREAGINWFLAARAMLFPTQSILHVVGFDVPVDHFYRWSPFYTIYLTDDEFEDLLTFVCSYFVTDENHKFIIVDRGLYGDSWFLKSKGKYIFPNTCNVWTAKALHAAHLPLTPVIYQHSDFLSHVLHSFSQKQKQHQNIRYVFNAPF